MTKLTTAEELMIRALLDLLEKKPYRDITIKELVLTAQVSRSTFYRHYASLDELLLRCMEWELQDFALELTRSGTETNYDVAVSYFRFWRGKQGFVRTLRENGLLSLFLDHYETFMFHIAEEVKYDGDAPNLEKAPDMPKYIYSYGMLGLWGMADRWLRTGCKETPEQLASYLMMFFTNAFLTEPPIRTFAETGTFPFPMDDWALYDAEIPRDI